MFLKLFSFPIEVTYKLLFWLSKSIVFIFQQLISTIFYLSKLMFNLFSYFPSLMPSLVGRILMFFPQMFSSLFHLVLNIPKMVINTLELLATLLSNLSKTSLYLLKLVMSLFIFMPKSGFRFVMVLFKVVAKSLITIFNKVSMIPVTSSKWVGYGILFLIKTPIHFLLSIMMGVSSLALAILVKLSRVLVVLNLVDDVVMLPVLPFFKFRMKKRKWF